MNKTTKGALAAGAAATLLLGGAGSLAFWTSSASVNGGSFTSGSLILTPKIVSPNTTACDTSWVYATGADKGTAITTIVPGDAISKKCTFNVEAVGDHITASPTVPSTVAVTTTPASGAAAPTTLSLPVAATYDLGGTALTSSSVISKADNGKTLTALITVTMPFGNATTINGNDTEKLTNTLSALQVTLTQTQNGNNNN